MSAPAENVEHQVSTADVARALGLLVLLGLAAGYVLLLVLTAAITVPGGWLVPAAMGGVAAAVAVAIWLSEKPAPGGAR